MVNPIPWRIATMSAIHDETPTVRTYTLALPEWPGHRAGQHVDLRLTAVDGFKLERSHSITSGTAGSGQIVPPIELGDGRQDSHLLHYMATRLERIEER